MRFTKILNSNLCLSKIAVGTMTFGEQTSTSEAYKILDTAHNNGINLIDTAEMYPIYPKNTTYGDSERIIGSYLKLKKKRNDFYLATKIASCNPKLHFSIRKSIFLIAKDNQI